MSSGDVHSTQSQSFLYEKTWWKMLFNFAGVLSAAFLVIVILAIGLVTLTQGRFLSSPNVKNLTQLWNLQAMLVPATLLIIAAGGIDLSIAAVMAATAILVASLAPVLSLPIAVFIGLAMALLVGIINGLVVGATCLNGAIVTLGMTVLLRGLVNLAAQGKTSAVLDPGFLAAPSFPWIGLIVAMVLGIPLILVCQGRKAAHKPDTDEGWGTRLFYVASPYILSSFIAGWVGLVYLARLRIAMPSLGAGFEIEALLIAILGGTPPGNLRINIGMINMIGGLIAALGLVLLQNVVQLANGPLTLLDPIKGILIIIGGPISYLYYFLVSRIHSRKPVEEFLPLPEQPSAYGGV